MIALDAYILATLYALRDPTVGQFFFFISQFGDTFVIGGLALTSGIYLLARRRLSDFVGLCIAVMLTIAIVYPLKDLVARARPDIVFYHIPAEDTFAFPSGHAAFSIALYGFLAYLAWKYLPRRYAPMFIIAAGTLVGLIGFSRLYLGLHFFSDVLAGYAIGAMCLALGIAAEKRLNLSRVWS